MSASVYLYLVFSVAVVRQTAFSMRKNKKNMIYQFIFSVDQNKGLRELKMKLKKFNKLLQPLLVTYMLFLRLL